MPKNPYIRLIASLSEWVSDGSSTWGGHIMCATSPCNDFPCWSCQHHRNMVPEGQSVWGQVSLLLGKATSLTSTWSTLAHCFQIKLQRHMKILPCFPNPMLLYSVYSTYYNIITVIWTHRNYHVGPEKMPPSTRKHRVNAQQIRSLRTPRLRREKFLFFKWPRLWSFAMSALENE